VLLIPINIKVISIEIFFPRFNERFILSLSSCGQCLVVDDQLNVLPVSSATLEIEAIAPKSHGDAQSPSELELSELKRSLEGTQPAHSLLSQTKTLDQAKALLKFVDAISEKTLRSIVTMTAARGRGKSAALGLSIATAVAYG
jgi:N-acetyltransferase 10